MSFFEHSFEGQVVFHDVGSSRYQYKVVFLPEAIVEQLPMKTHPRLRITGEIGGHHYEGACTPVRGRHYLLLSNPFLKAIDADVGDGVEVRFNIGDQEAVDTPQALLHAFQEAPEIQELWSALTPGKQRGLAYMVASAKTEPTVAKRIGIVFDILQGKRDQRGKLI